MSDPERKSAMARTLERLKSRKRNVQGTPSPGSVSSTPPALATTSPAPQPSPGVSEHGVKVVQPPQIFPFSAVEAKPVIMYSFPSEDGSTNTVPLVELSQVNMAQSPPASATSNQIQLQQSFQNQQNQNHQTTVFDPKIVSVTSSSTVPLIDLESGVAYSYSEISDKNEEVPVPKDPWEEQISNRVQPQQKPCQLPNSQISPQRQVNCSPQCNVSLISHSHFDLVIFEISR